jgi:hypothetical protein
VQNASQAVTLCKVPGCVERHLCYVHCVDSCTLRKKQGFLHASGTVYVTTLRDIVEDLNFAGILTCSSDAECPRYGTRSSLAVFTIAPFDAGLRRFSPVAVSINNSCMVRFNIIPTHGVPFTVPCFTPKHCAFLAIPAVK